MRETEAGNNGGLEKGYSDENETRRLTPPMPTGMGRFYMGSNKITPRE